MAPLAKFTRGQRMDLEEMRKHKSELEARLRTVAAEVVHEFQRRTGCAVRGVDVQLIDVTTFGDRTPKVEVSGVELRIEL
jgi:hypothetical protein